MKFSKQLICFRQRSTIANFLFLKKKNFMASNLHIKFRQQLLKAIIKQNYLKYKANVNKHDREIKYCDNKHTLDK